MHSIGYGAWSGGAEDGGNGGVTGQVEAVGHQKAAEGGEEDDGGASSSAPPAPSPPPPPPVAVVDTSPYVLECASLVASFRAEFLSKFVPIPSPNVASCVASLVERMASRLLLFFIRHASLVRGLMANATAGT